MKIRLERKEFSFPRLIVLPLSWHHMAVNSSGQHKIDGVRKEKERLTAAPEGYNLVEEDHMLVKPFQEFFHLGRIGANMLSF